MVNRKKGDNVNADVVVTDQFTLPVSQKFTKLKPNLLKRKYTFNPTMNFCNNVSSKCVELKTVKPLENSKSSCQDIMDYDDDGDAEVFILDQSEYVPLLENLEASNGGGCTSVENEENIEEIVVDQNQVQLLNEPNKLSQCGDNFVCRTCLSLTDIRQCKKLFDAKCKEGQRLREKLAFIAVNINYKASVNPLVCLKCVILIDISYNFIKQVKEVEERIMKKINQGFGKSIDLLSLLEKDAAHKEVPRENDLCSKTHPTAISLEKTTGVQRIKKIKISQKPDEAVNLRNVGQNNLLECETRTSSGSVYRNLDEYLVTRGKQLKKVRASIIKSPLPNTRMTANNHNKPINNHLRYDRIFLGGKKSEEPLKKNGESVDKPESDKNTGQGRSDLLNLEAAVGYNRERGQFTDLTDLNKSSGLSQDCRSSLDACQARRLKKFNYTNQFSNLNIKLRKPKRPLDGEQEPTSIKDNGKVEEISNSPAYEYLFNTSKITKKKPNVPKTWDLFDEEHDRYFKNLIGEAGCFMVKKWSRFSRRPLTMGGGPYLCDICGFANTNSVKFYRHKSLHKDTKAMCSYCGELVKNNVCLKYHIAMKHTTPTHECNQCGKKFHLSLNLASHISKVHEAYMVQCQICGKMIKKPALKSHMMRHNPDNTPFNCDVCGRVYRNYNNWSRHRKIHFATERYKCSRCHKMFKTKGTLGQHINQVHYITSKWSCSICNKMLCRKESLNRHMRVRHGTIHKGERKRKQKVAKEQEERYEDRERVTSTIVDEAKVADKIRIINHIRVINETGNIEYKYISDENTESYSAAS